MSVSKSTLFMNHLLFPKLECTQKRADLRQVRLGACGERGVQGRLMCVHCVCMRVAECRGDVMRAPKNFKVKIPAKKKKKKITSMMSLHGRK